MGQFKAIPNTDDKAEVNSKGVVRLKSKHVGAMTIRNFVVKPTRGLFNGFLAVNLRVNAKTKRFFVHRVTAEAFVNNPHGFNFVVFKDGDRLNVHFKNLEWSKNTPRVKRDGGLKLTLLESRAIMKELSQGVKGIEIAKKYDVSPSLISRIKAGTRWN